MLNKSITYDALFDEDKVGEIKDNIYYDSHGRDLYIVKNNSVFYDNKLIGPISIDKNGPILTRYADEQILTLKPKNQTS